MFRIENHIEILLLNHDCVIIPGLGGFVTHHVPAHFDCADGMMLPPYVTVGFNPQLKLNDSLLTQSYADAYEISYPEASQMVDEDVALIRKHLEDNGNWNIHSVGEFTMNSNGRYEFEPCETGIVRPEYYAFTGIETGIRADIAPTNAEQQTEADIIQEQEDNNNDIRISRSTLKKLVAACVILTVIITSAFNHKLISDKLQECSFNLNTFEELFSQEKTAEKPVTVIKLDAKPETTNIVTAKEAEEEVEKETVVAAEEVIEEAVKPYAVVLASQVTLPNAEEFIAKMKAKGYDDIRIIGDKLKNRKIVYGSYATYEEANDAKREFNKEEEFANAWVTEIKQ